MRDFNDKIGCGPVANLVGKFGPGVRNERRQKTLHMDKKLPKVPKIPKN